MFRPVVRSSSGMSSYGFLLANNSLKPVPRNSVTNLKPSLKQKNAIVRMTSLGLADDAHKTDMSGQKAGPPQGNGYALPLKRNTEAQWQTLRLRATARQYCAGKISGRLETLLRH